MSGISPARRSAPMWRRPNSWKPGESISALVRSRSSQYHCVAVVVWRPVLSACDQRARQLRFAEHRLGGDDDEQLVDVGGERLGLPLVLAVEQIGSRQDGVDDAFVARSLPAHPVADDGVALLAA